MADDIRYWVNDDGEIDWLPYAFYTFAHLQGAGYSDTPYLTSGVSVLYVNTNEDSPVLSAQSGVGDADGDGVLDQWSTDDYGVVSWVVLTAHPYTVEFAPEYYSDDLTLINKRSVLWNDYRSVADPILYASGTSDVDKDGNLDAWTTNGGGIIKWNIIPVHPFKQLGYFTDTIELTSGTSVIWSGIGTGAIGVSSLEGVGDLDYDGNLDSWSTDENGVITWFTKVFYPIRFLDTEYFITQADSINLQSGNSVLYNGRFSSATPVANASATDVYVDGDDVVDTWYTNDKGVLFWTKVVRYPFSFVGLSGYTNTEYITSGVTELYDTPYIDAQLVTLSSGIYLNRDNDLNEWSTNENGIITWTQISAHPYLQLNNYYTDSLELTSGQSVLWNKVGTGATLISLSSGQAYIDNIVNLNSWSTNLKGIITWSLLSSHPYPAFYGYSDTFNIVSGVTKLWSSQYSSATAIPLSSGTADANKDNNIDTWSTNESGIITFAPLTSHPFKQTIGSSIVYTDTQNLIRNVTYFWDGFGTGAKILSSFIPTQSRAILTDLDNDGDLDYILSNADGTYTWAMYKQYPYSVLNNTYYASGPLVSGQSKVYLTQGSGSAFVVSLSNTAFDSDINGDGNLGSWKIDNQGIVEFELFRKYPYVAFSAATNSDTQKYYTEIPGLTSGSSQIFRGFGTAALTAINLSGSALIDSPTRLSFWQTNNRGIVTWVPLTSHPFSQVVGFSDTAILTSNVSRLFTNQYSDSELVGIQAGQADIDGDGNLDDYRIDNGGIITWTTASAHPFKQFPGSLSAADVQVVTTPISVAGNFQIPNTNFTYYQITAYDTRLTPEGTLEPTYVNLDDHYPVPTPEGVRATQTYYILTAADVAPVVINGVTQTTPISVAGNETIPGTSFTYSMIPRSDGYTDVSIPANGDKLYVFYGSGSPTLNNVQGYSLVGPHSANWSTNNFGSLSIAYVTAHPHFQFTQTNDTGILIDNYYTDVRKPISGVTILWNDYRSGASIVADRAGVNDIDKDGNTEAWYTDAFGIIHFTLSVSYGTYFYSTIDRDWFSRLGWYQTEDKELKASAPANAEINVIILSGTLVPLANINNQEWIQPNSIDASHGGIEFTSVSSAAITCPLSGSEGNPVRFSGKTSWDIPSPVLYGRYWKSFQQSTSWFNLSNWYVDSETTIRATALPLAADKVVVTVGAIIPRIDLDNPLWTQPKIIDARGIGIRIFTRQGRTVDATRVYGPIL